jgi:hypothetical protein
MSRFTERIAEHHDRPVEAACAVRAPYSILIPALCAGLGAGVGSVLGDTLGAGVGGGLGALVGSLVNWLRLLPSELSVAMALVLGPDRLELLRLGLGNRPRATIRSIPYAGVAAVETRDGVLSVGITLRTADEALELQGGKHGVGAAPEVVAQLRRRIAA